MTMMSVNRPPALSKYQELMALIHNVGTTMSPLSEGNQIDTYS